MGPLAPATAATPKVVTDRAVLASGDSNQHSLWTWLTFLGSNATMAA